MYESNPLSCFKNSSKNLTFHRFPYNHSLDLEIESLTQNLTILTRYFLQTNNCLFFFINLRILILKITIIFSDKIEAYTIIQQSMCADSWGKFTQYVPVTYTCKSLKGHQTCVIYYNIYILAPSSIENFKINQYRNFQLIWSMRFHFMRFFVINIIPRVSHRPLY